MNRKLPYTVGLLVFVASLSPNRTEAEGGILSRLHQHQGTCEANASVVRLPAQEIRIETTRPRVVVNDHSRARGFFPTGPAFVPYASQGPFVATFMPMTVHGGYSFGHGSQPASNGSPALRALHEMEMHAAEVNRLRAAHKADMDHLEKVHDRVRSSMAPPVNSASPNAEIEQLKTAIDNLSKKVSDIERLLIIHDNILMKQNQPK